MSVLTRDLSAKTSDLLVTSLLARALANMIASSILNPLLHQRSAHLSPGQTREASIQLNLRVFVKYLNPPFWRPAVADELTANSLDGLAGLPTHTSLDWQQQTRFNWSHNVRLAANANLPAALALSSLVMMEQDGSHVSCYR